MEVGVDFGVVLGLSQVDIDAGCDGLEFFGEGGIFSCYGLQFGILVDCVVGGDGFLKV